MSASDLAAAFRKANEKTSKNPEKTLDKVEGQVIVKSINLYQKMFQELPQDDLDLLSEVFHVSRNGILNASEETLKEFCEIICSDEFQEDGAPEGNKNAEGPHKRNHLSSKDKEKYKKRIVGQKTSDGVEVKAFGDHAFDRIAQRNMSAKRIENMLQSKNVSPDKEHPDTRRCYDVPGSRLVLNHTNGTIVTIEWRRKNK